MTEQSRWDKPWVAYTHLDEHEIQRRLSEVIGPRRPHLTRLVHGLTHPWTGEVHPRRAEFTKSRVSKNSFIELTKVQWKPSVRGGCDVQITTGQHPLSSLLMILMGLMLLGMPCSIGFAVVGDLFGALVRGLFAGSWDLPSSFVPASLFLGCAVVVVALVVLFARMLVRPMLRNLASESAAMLMQTLELVDES